MPAFQALRIAIVGGGKIGSALAFQLVAAGRHDVTVIARPDSARLGQLRRDKAIIKVGGERAQVSVGDQLDESIAYDLVIVTAAAHQIDVLIAPLQRCAARGLLFMFNNFHPERLIGLLGNERCDFGMPLLQASLDDDGRLNATIGAYGAKTKLGRQRWVDVFNAAGVPAAVEPDMPLWLRCHVPLCVAFESIAVAGVRGGGGASWAQASVLARGMHESFALIRGLGYPLYPAGKSRLAASPRPVVALMLWSMSRIRSFRELLAGGVNECRALVDAMAAVAHKAQPAVTVATIEAMKPPKE